MTETLAGIALRAIGRQAAADRVFFTFGDGRLAYDCVACGAQCCRGHGFAVSNDGAARVLGDQAPLVKIFSGRVGALPVVHNLPPTCFFLQQDNRCGVHSRFGYAAKPETCRTFPFNQLRLLDDVLLVSPHPRLCPLTVVDPPMRSPASRHGTLREELVSFGVGGKVALCQEVHEKRTMVSFERQLLAFSERQLALGVPLEAFTDAQVSLQLPGPAERRGAVPSAAKLGALAAEALGVSAEDLLVPIPRVDALMVAATPTLRAQILFPVRDGGSQGVPVAAERIPILILAIGWLTRLACRAGMTTINWQTIMRIARDLQSLAWLLAHLDASMKWRSRKPINFAAGPHDGHLSDQCARIARVLAGGGKRSSIPPLGAVVMEHNRWDGTERILFLKFVGARLAARVTGTEGGETTRRLNMSKGSLQRTGLRLVPDAAVPAFVSRMRRGSRSTSTRDDICL